MEPIPRPGSITGVARALLATGGPDDTVGILVGQFGWDVAFAGLAGVEGDASNAALWRALEYLDHDDLAA